MIEDPPALNGGRLADVIGDIAGGVEAARADPDAVVVQTLEANPMWSLIDAREAVANHAGVDLAAAARFVATRRPIAEVLERWEQVLFPIVLIGLGVVILVEGGAFGL